MCKNMSLSIELALKHRTLIYNTVKKATLLCLDSEIERQLTSSSFIHLFTSKDTLCSISSMCMQ